MAVFHFCSSYEGTATTAETITFSRSSVEMTITNDHASDPLCFKFDAAENYATVYPKESVTVKMASPDIIIDGLGLSVPYRIWVFTP